MLKIWAQNLTLVLLGILIAAALTEAGFRLFKKEDPLSDIRYVYEADPEVGFVLTPNAPPRGGFHEGVPVTFWSNNFGCFDNLYAGEPHPILLVGDSFTGGFTTLFKDKWGTVLGDLLGVRVVQCGTGGYGTRQELAIAERVAAKISSTPRIIIVGYYVNDLGNDYVFPEVTVRDGYLAMEKYLADPATGEIKEFSASRAFEKNTCGFQYAVPAFVNQGFCFLQIHSVAYRTLKEPLKTALVRLVGKQYARDLVAAEQHSYWILSSLLFARDGAYPWLASAWETHRENIHAFKAFADRVGAPLVFVLIPSKEQVYDYLREHASPLAPDNLDFENQAKKLIPILDAEGIAHIDLLPLFRERTDQQTASRLTSEDSFYYNEGHWNTRGNHLGGIGVAQAILDQKLVPFEPKTLEAVREKIEQAMAK